MHTHTHTHTHTHKHTHTHSHTHTHTSTHTDRRVCTYCHLHKWRQSLLRERQRLLHHPLPPRAQQLNETLQLKGRGGTGEGRAGVREHQRKNPRNSKAATGTGAGDTCRRSSSSLLSSSSEGSKELTAAMAATHVSLHHTRNSVTHAARSAPRDFMSPTCKASRTRARTSSDESRRGGSLRSAAHLFSNTDSINTLSCTCWVS